MDIRGCWIRARAASRAVVIALSISLGATSALMPTANAEQAPAEVQERARLLTLRRDAVTQLQQAARVGAPADEVRRALRDASRSLEVLSAVPSFAPALRSELRRAASELKNLASRDTR